jgi:hypothetical protein
MCYCISMPWHEKHNTTPFYTTPIEGLFFLHGDVLAKLVGRDWTKGQKLPLITFPSGVECELWESVTSEQGGIVHLFGEMDLPLYSTHDEAYEAALAIAEMVGYLVRLKGVNQIEVMGYDRDERFILTYDDEQGRLVDVVQVNPREAAPERPQVELLDAKSREQLPPLYANETLGLNALAQVKFFTPDGSWTWYASEFDGVDTFFGLVAGLEVELGYFSLSELQEVRGALGLAVERDKFFTPTH